MKEIGLKKAERGLNFSLKRIIIICIIFRLAK